MPGIASLQMIERSKSGHKPELMVDSCCPELIFQCLESRLSCFAVALWALWVLKQYYPEAVWLLIGLVRLPVATTPIAFPADLVAAPREIRPSKSSCTRIAEAELLRQDNIGTVFFGEEELARCISEHVLRRFAEDPTPGGEKPNTPFRFFPKNGINRRDAE